ncbi:MAG: VPLPA-CTERM sorting domain-containing protein [Qingshengfaniella sp.]
MTVSYFVGDAQNIGQDFILASGAAFSTYTLMFDVTVAGPGHLQIGQSGPADFRGAILDNVVIDYQPAVVPLPATAVLLVGGVAALGVWRRRV